MWGPLDACWSEAPNICKNATQGKGGEKMREEERKEGAKDARDGAPEVRGLRPRGTSTHSCGSSRPT